MRRRPLPPPPPSHQLIRLDAATVFPAAHADDMRDARKQDHAMGVFALLWRSSMRATSWETLLVVALKLECSLDGKVLGIPVLIDALEARHVTDTAMRSFRASPARMAREVHSAEVHEKVEKERVRKEIRVAERAAGGTQAESLATSSVQEQVSSSQA
ncbi:hypothetical protein EV714DRAFT_278504 [Schizophyllum commune]